MKLFSKVGHAFMHFISKKGVRFSGIYLGLFSLSLGISYFGSPLLNSSSSNAEETVVLEEEEEFIDTRTPADFFMLELTSITGLHGHVNSCEISLPDSDGSASTYNKIALSGDFSLGLPDLDNIGFDFNIDVSYLTSDIKDAYQKNLYLNYCNKDLYLSLGDLKVSYLDAESSELKEDVKNTLGSDYEALVEVFNGLVVSFTSSSSSGENGDISLEKASLTINVLETGHYENGYSFDVEITYGELTGIQIDNFTYEGITVSCDLDITTDKDALSVVKAKASSIENKESYTSLYNLKGIFHNIYNLVKLKQFDIEVDGSIDRISNDINENYLISGNLSADLNKQNYDANLLLTYLDKEKKHYSKSIDASLRTNEEKYIAYLDYNNLMKVSLSQEIFEELLGRVQSDFSLAFTSSSSSENIFEFILQSEAVKDVQNCHFDSLLSSITSIVTASNLLTINLSLDSFGFGKEASVLLLLNGAKNAYQEIKLSNVEIGEFLIEELNLKLGTYSEKEIATEEYYTISALPTIFDQVKNLTQTQRAKIAIEGGFASKKSQSFQSFSGTSTFDIAAKKGTGEINIIQKVNGSAATKNHHVTIDVTGPEESAGQMNFHYNDGSLNNEGLWGTISISSLNSVISTIKKLLSSEDERFTKFLDPLKESMASTAIGLITSGHYPPLLKMNILKDVKLNQDSSEFVINSDLIGLGEGVFTLTLSRDSGRITDLEISNLPISNENSLNLKVSLLTTSFADSELISIEEMPSNTYEFNGIDTLIDCVYQTSQQESFKLIGEDVGLTILGLYNIDFDIVCHIFVNGKEVRVYAEINNIPELPVASNNYKLFRSTTRNVKLYYENVNPETGKPYEDNSGYLYLEANTIYSKENHYEYFKYHTSYLSEGNNLLFFLLTDVLDIKKSLYEDQLTSSSEEDKAIAYENILTKYKYSDYSWDLGISLSALTNNDSLGDLNVTIAADSTSNYLSSLSFTTRLYTFITAKGTFNNENPRSDNWDSVHSLWQNYISTHISDSALSA